MQGTDSLMAMIKRYGELPAVFVPDEGEVVIASRSPAGPFLRAAITKVRRARDGFIRVDFVWLEAAPYQHNGKPISPGDKGHVYVRRDDRVPLIRRVPAEPADRPKAV
jgi:hypothetical protein